MCGDSNWFLAMSINDPTNCKVHCVIRCSDRLFRKRNNQINAEAYCETSLNFRRTIQNHRQGLLSSGVGLATLWPQVAARTDTTGEFSLGITEPSLIQL